MSFSIKSKTFSEGKCPSTGCIQKKPNGKWGIISNKTGEFWDADYDTEDDAKAGLAAYHTNKHFSDIKSDEEFMTACHEAAKAILGDAYNKETTEETAKGILKDHKDEGFDAMMGIFVNGLRGDKKYSSKTFSFIPLDKDPSVIKDKDDKSNKSTTTKVPEVTSLNIGKAFKMNVEPYLMAQAMNNPADGIYLGSLENEYITIDNDSKIILNIKTSTNGPLSVLAFIKNNRVYIWKCSQLVEGNKTFSNLAGFDIAIPEVNLSTSEAPTSGYSFDLMPDEIKYDMDHLIGSWMLATSVCHLFHVCETDYAGHIALGDFYEGFPEKIDALAEHYLSDSDMARFRVCIVPKSCPIDYLERLVAYTEDYAANVKFPSDYQSQIDDILNFTKSTLYKLKRLTSGRKIFK